MWDSFLTFLLSLAHWIVTNLNRNFIIISHQTYILIRHLPVWPLAVWHNFPHDNPIAPYIAGRGELPVSNSLWSCPANRNLPTLGQNTGSITTNIMQISQVIEVNLSLEGFYLLYSLYVFTSKLLLILQENRCSCCHSQAQTLVPHVVRPAITRMNINLGTHSSDKVSLSFTNSMSELSGGGGGV